jgi:hypothetical protein
LPNAAYFKLQSSGARAGLRVLECRPSADWPGPGARTGSGLGCLGGGQRPECQEEPVGLLFSRGNFDLRRCG